MLKRILSDVVIFAAIIIIGLQVDNVRRAISTKHPFTASPVTYGELIPDKTEYAPGDLITFEYERSAQVTGEPLLMLTVDSFENLDTGEIFTGTFASRIVRDQGLAHLKASRRLSPDATPGTYTFEGWISIQGKEPIRSVPYHSRKFTVKPK